MRGKRQAGFTIPVTMLLVSILMVLSTAIVVMTVASFRDAARTRNRAEILNVSEIGLKLAVSEIGPGLSLIPNAYWSFATMSASMSVSAAATPSEPSTDVTHEFQVFANVRNWSPFADWTQWNAAQTYTQNLMNRDWSNGWWVVPRNRAYDDTYYNEDANPDDDYPTTAPARDRADAWLYKNPASGSAMLAFPVRLGTSSVPVENLYWYWLTETMPNTPTNTQLRNGGLVDPYWVNSPPVIGGNTVADRDVGIGAWSNRTEYQDSSASHTVNYDSGPTTYRTSGDRYNFLNTPVLKKIYTVDHRGKKIRVAVYCRMILREYFLDTSGATPSYPVNFLKHMRRHNPPPNEGPKVIFYLVAVNESTANQRGVRVQQAIYAPVGPANPQDPDSTLRSGLNRLADNDGAMFPGAMNLLMDKKLLEGATISGRILPASGDFSYRVPVPLFNVRAKNYTTPASLNEFHPHWVYLIEWNGKEPLLVQVAPGEAYLSTNSALIWQVPNSNPPRWRRTAFREDDGTATGKARILGTPIAAPTLGNGATPSAYANVWGAFTIGDRSDLTIAPASGSLAFGETRWLGPGVDAWGGSTRASMSYILTTELQIPDQVNANARFSRPVTATRSATMAPGPGI